MKFMTEADFTAQLEALKEHLMARLKAGEPASAVVRDQQLRAGFGWLRQLPGPVVARAGRRLNQLKQSVLDYSSAAPGPDPAYLDVTAPMAIGCDRRPDLVNPEAGSIHPVNLALESVLAIFARMGFEAVESRQIDSQYYMFDALNFPVDHPARAEFDTFILDQTDHRQQPLVAPAHTSTMQNRILKANKAKLAANQALAYVVPGRVFRNEDVDASHDHMFYQLEGIYVDRDVSVANLVATLQTFIRAYYRKPLAIKIQPFYFPFTEPSFEMAIGCPFCFDRNQTGCRVCANGWIELLGCGLIHPNVLKQAGIDPGRYSGFAWGLGLMRLVMIKDSIEDIRHFAAGRLGFLRQFRF